ncbi:hypothetical protein [Streptomyces maremycinicus]|uniref:hypothetical protein n=1 Tax=Streptomyces maremycinicus TaxID=1679753 RepID=UPI0007880819|nr:hypothetical protein [Streptomyces sp. NBRC 110468]
MSEAAQDTTRVQQAGQTARAEASATADQAQQAAGQVAGTAAEQAKAVAGEARQQAGVVADDLRRRAMDEVEGQTRRAAGVLHQWADDLAGLADNAPSDSPARSLAAQAADGGHRTADYLEKQGVDGVLSDVQSFARRRPGAFLGGALLAGFAVGRMVKVAAKADTSSGTQHAALGTSAPSPGAPQEPPVPAMSPAVPQPLATPAGDAPGRPGPGV